MTEQSTLVRLDTDRLKTPVVGQLRTQTVFLQTQTDADAKIYSSAHLHERRLSIEIKGISRIYVVVK